jgi:hypothetical protein
VKELKDRLQASPTVQQAYQAQALKFELAHQLIAARIEVNYGPALNLNSFSSSQRLHSAYM